jgi:hypothetical protein
MPNLLRLVIYDLIAHLSSTLRTISLQYTNDDEPAHALPNARPPLGAV